MKHFKGNLSLNTFWREILETSPVIKKTISEYGHLTLLQYIDILQQKSFLPIKSTPVFEVLEELTQLYIGKKIARQVCDDLQSCFMALSAHHYGLDTYSQSIQSSLFFSKRNIKNSQAKTILVLACGNVTLQSLTYPGGLIIYRIGEVLPERWPQRFGLLPHRLKSKCVYNAPSLTKEMCINAQAKSERMSRKRLFTNNISINIDRIIKDVFLSNITQEQKYFSQQATIFNYHLWKKIYPECSLVYLQLEEFASKLIIRDLKDPKSLFFKILFESNHAQQMISSLGKQNLISTHFFWGLTDKGKKFKLSLENDKLIGSDHKGNKSSLIFSSKNIIQSLQNNEIMPSVFTCFLIISFIYGLNCVGGYYQSSYLPKMHSITKNILGDKFNLPDVATDLYLSGMQALTENDLPMGLIEIIDRGGISNDLLEKTMNITVAKAHRNSIFDTVLDFFPERYPLVMELLKVFAT